MSKAKIAEQLRLLSTQGIGQWDNEQKCIVDNHGRPWKHWATRANEILEKMGCDGSSN